MQVISPVKATPEISRMRAVADSLSKRWWKHSALCSEVDNDFGLYCVTHGFNNVMIGNLPEKELKTARSMLKLAHETLTAAGLDTTRMFAFEIVRAMFSIEQERYKAREKRMRKAVTKLKEYQLSHEFPALANTSKIVEGCMIPYYSWVNNAMFLPTDTDKKMLWEAKSATIERVLQAMADHEWVWAKVWGGETKECDISEFKEIANMSSWIDFNQTRSYYDQTTLQNGGLAVCHQEPKPGSTTLSIEIEFELHSTFDICSDGVAIGHFGGYPQFTAHREQKI